MGSAQMHAVEPSLNANLKSDGHRRREVGSIKYRGAVHMILLRKACKLEPPAFHPVDRVGRMKISSFGEVRFSNTIGGIGGPAIFQTVVDEYHFGGGRVVFGANVPFHVRFAVWGEGRSPISDME